MRSDPYLVAMGIRIRSARTLTTSIAAAIAVLCLSGCGASAAPAATPGSAALDTPSSSPGVSLSPTPSPTPSVAPTATSPSPSAAQRPTITLGTECADLVTQAALDAAAGAAVILSDGSPERPWALRDAMIDYSGGLTCRWATADDDSAAVGSVTVAVVPGAEPAWAAIETAFSEAHASPLEDEVPDVESYCYEDHCQSAGFIGSNWTLIRIAAPGRTEPSAEIAAAFAEIEGSLAALPAPAELPPHDPAWDAGPTSCAEMLSTGDLESALGEPAGSIEYRHAYSYEGSNVPFGGLLTAGGFVCRVVSTQGISPARVMVLPDASDDLLATLARDPDAEIIDVAGVPHGQAAVNCWSNGATFGEQWTTGSCTIDFPSRGAWVTVHAAKLGTGQAELTTDAAAFAAVIAAALTA